MNPKKSIIETRKTQQSEVFISQFFILRLISPPTEPGIRKELTGRKEKKSTRYGPFYH